MIRIYHPLHLLLYVGLIALYACCPVNSKLLGDPRNPYPLHSQPKVGDIVHLRTGKAVNLREMTNLAGEARVVYMGETHDNPASHRLELQVLEGLAELHPGGQALGMEMFVRSQQPALDRWVAGKLDEKEFLRESRWFDNWSIDFAYYRDLLIFARDRRIPVVALNAEKDLVTAVRGKPVDQIGAADRARLPELDMTDPYQTAMAKAYFSDHSHGGIGVDGFVRSQTVWDETMAESVARYLASPEGKKRHLLVIAGGNHVNYGFGIPRRVFRRLPTSYLLIGGKEIRIPKEKEVRMMNVSLPSLPMPPYDFIAYIDYEDLQKSGFRLGVMIEPAGKGRGLIVRDIVPGSYAERAGIKKNDLLLTLDGISLEDNLDLIYSLKQKRPGDHLNLKVEREGKPMIVEFLIPPTEEKTLEEKK